MQRLVDYESSDESEDVVLHTIKPAQQEEIEVSTMLQAGEGVPFEPTHDSLLAKPRQLIGCSHEQAVEALIAPQHDSDEIVLAKLLEFGCSHEQAAQALSVCGRGAPISDLFDYIQACNCNIGDESCCAPKALDFEEDPEIRLKDMGYTEVYILNALKACGKQSTIPDMVDFIQAHYCIEDASCTENMVAKRHLIGLNSESGESTSKQLQEMGCSCEHIAKAISVCGENTHVSDLFDFIQASQYPLGCALDAPAYEENGPLNEMGFTKGHIEDALRACGKQSSTLDIADFVLAHFSNGDEDDVADVVGRDIRQTTVADEPVPKILAQQSAGINVTKETMVQHEETIAALVKERQQDSKI